MLSKLLVPENLNKFFQIFRLRLWKRFMLETEVIVFTITLLCKKRLSTQNNMSYKNYKE